LPPDFPNKVLVGGWSGRGGRCGRLKGEGAGDVVEERGQLGRWGTARPARPVAQPLCPRAEPAAHPTPCGGPDDPPLARGGTIWSRLPPLPSPAHEATGHRPWPEWRGAPLPAG